MAKKKKLAYYMKYNSNNVLKCTLRVLNGKAKLIFLRVRSSFRKKILTPNSKGVLHSLCFTRIPIVRL